jgi:putative DNA primase/helicase
MTSTTHSDSAQHASPSDPVARVLNRLDNVAEITNGWTARCPAHDDNMNSLSVSEGTDGRALIYCHAGCTFKGIVSGLGIRVRDLFVQERGCR